MQASMSVRSQHAYLLQKRCRVVKRCAALPTAHAHAWQGCSEMEVWDSGILWVQSVLHQMSHYSCHGERAAWSAAPPPGHAWDSKMVQSLSAQHQKSHQSCHCVWAVLRAALADSRWRLATWKAASPPGHACLDCCEDAWGSKKG